MEYDIKLMLAMSPAMRLQWKEIFNTLYAKYKNKHKTPNSFGVTLHRKLEKLIRSSDLEKEEKGHQQVFYFIPKKRQEKVIEELERAYIFKKFDDFWDMFSLEQRKKIIRDSAAQQQLFILSMQNFTLQFLSMTQDLVEPWIAKLEKPTEDIKARYSPEERKKFLKELYMGRKELESIKSKIARDSQPIRQEEYRELMTLTQEFMNKVVPKYPGGWREAFMDLMRKAVEEQTEKGKGR
jgi:hypothetical protein